MSQREAMGEVGDPCLSVAILVDAILCRAGSAGCVVAQHDVYDARNRIRAILGRCAVAQDLHTLDRGRRNGVQIDRHRAAAIGAVRDEQEEACQRSEEHTSELQSLMRISYAVFCLKKKKYKPNIKSSIRLYSESK